MNTLIAPMIRCVAITAATLATLALAQPTPPTVQTYQGIAYVTGGVGEDSEEGIRQVAKDYNLKMSFALKGSGAYLADVKVNVQDAKGKVMLDAVSEGPCLLAKMPPGKYKVSAEIRGVPVVKQASIAGPRSGARLAFTWPGEQIGQEPDPTDRTQRAEESKGGHGVSGCW